MPSLVVAIGPLPPPTHGFSENTKIITDRLRGRCRLRVVDTSPGSPRRSPLYYARRVWREVRGGWELLRGVTAPTRRTYLPAAGAGGLLFTVLHAGIARLAGYGIAVHHHSFAYIEERSALMGLLVRFAGPEAVHIFLCDVMRRRFEGQYGACRNGMIVSNAFYIRANLARERTAPDSGVLGVGHMSNLSHEKGLDDFLDLLRALRQAGIAFRGVLAGPAATPAAAEAIAAAQRELGAALDYRGPVYGEAKAAFFGDIDVFVFPTRYKFEAQPNVVFEAFSFGVPVIAFARGCVASDLPETCGTAVPVGADFIAAARARLAAWSADPAALAASARAARQAALSACDDSERSVEEMLAAISGSR
ncbi:MAG TPA: glycosyltransferase [Thermoanaerobaculia bacterium]|nr:glycosyltransferase [Thermoanaerobaculia bacterium]